MFKIDKGVLMLATSRGAAKYPFREMDIGDSFWAEKTSSVRGAAVSFGLRHGKKFSSRKEGDGYRIWRVA